MNLRRKSARLLELVVAFLLLAGLYLPARAADAPRSLIAIGDIHGDFDDFTAILRKTGLINSQNRWTGANATLVQLGDLIDRGPQPREVLDLLMSLQKQAPESGGKVVVLLGNHETMNIVGDLRYVTVGNYASFDGPDSEQRRRDSFREYWAWRSSHPQLLAEVTQPVFEESEAEWMTRHPPGYLEQREAFSSQGIYGKWLRERPAIAEIEGTVFVHGGISPELSSSSVDELNSRIHSELQAFDNTVQYLIAQRIILPFFTFDQIVLAAQAELIAEQKDRVSANEERRTRLADFLQNFQSWLIGERPDGPLWFRGYDQWDEDLGQAKIVPILTGFKANRIVVGHTPQKAGQIRSRFDDKVFLIDTGMLSSHYPGGQPSALVIQDGTIFADYMNQRVQMLPKTGKVQNHKSATEVTQGEVKH